MEPFWKGRNGTHYVDTYILEDKTKFTLIISEGQNYIS